MQITAMNAAVQGCAVLCCACCACHDCKGQLRAGREINSIRLRAVCGVQVQQPKARETASITRCLLFLPGIVSQDIGHVCIAQRIVHIVHRSWSVWGQGAEQGLVKGQPSAAHADSYTVISVLKAIVNIAEPDILDSA